MVKERLVKKRMVDVDEMLDFLLYKTEVYIGDDYYRDAFEESLRKEVEKFVATVVPDVEIGQTVWVITDGEYDFDTQKFSKVIKKCYVHRKTIKKKYTFTVRGDGFYIGNFVKSSIGKTVFLTEEEAIKHEKTKIH
ncbi:hypothetical protein [Enterocloster clostridioformis]|uniref:Uncharacterized protein n=1 Tax=Enterocloster clostridioformis TaxID=1531 RepID=A0AAP9S5N9_9FIRM|nr:hypothetical protein [Enterocloster clostridioformis]EHG33265.1 hypothetical protein HMPREF9467_00876 [ [[Clostridium] clostridioforme 2_1_49FAA]ENZ28621.1 hypothetical protein HMPREF1087_01114 [[Clostridium] clostridioforme 90A1]ENZ73448.1 hypothetical protein HMPREF1081_00057 [[Clostridium] clostridioforme 90A4]QIX89189.1 hypothetical protein FOC47_00470 [Enterocloster clostridioformis]